MDAGDVLHILVKDLVGDAINISLNGSDDSSEDTDLIGTTLATTTPAPFDDWFLPSKNELDKIYEELYLHGVGGLDAFTYWSSSEFNATGVWSHNFITDFQGISNKTNSYKVRACRSFTVSDVYSLRDLGEAGGLIFNIVDNGDGTYTYYEAAPSDQSTGIAWSNIDSVLIGTTGTLVGTGSANTLAIIGQVGHTNSAAKLCDDLIV